MFRSRLAVLCLTGALAACGQAQPMKPDGATVSTVEIETIKLTPCPEFDEGRACEFTHVNAPKDFDSALKGDYQAQRNTGFVLAHQTVGMTRRPIQGCAWRMVLLVSNSPQVNGLDTKNYELDCADLSERDLGDATTVAGLIYRRVYGADLPKLPSLPSRN